jgi:hypothetical protein
MSEEPSLDSSRCPLSFVNLPSVMVMKEGDHGGMVISLPVRAIPSTNSALPRMFSESDFPPIKEMGEKSVGNKSKVMVASSSSRAWASIQLDQFIS